MNLLITFHSPTIAIITNLWKAFKDFFKRRLGIIRYVVIIYNYVRYFSKFQLLLIYMSFILYKIYNDWKLSF